MYKASQCTTDARFRQSTRFPCFDVSTKIVACLSCTEVFWSGAPSAEFPTHKVLDGAAVIVAKAIQ